MKMGQKFNKFRLLMWKNWILQIRSPKQTLAEIITPVVFCLILVIIRSLMNSTHHSAILYKPFKNEIPVLWNFTTPSIELAWSPRNPMLEQIVTETINAIDVPKRYPRMKQKSFNNLEDLDSYLDNSIIKEGTLAGIDFGDSLSTASSLGFLINVTLKFPGELRRATASKTTSYTLLDYSWKTNLIFPVYQTGGPRAWDMNTGSEPSYFFEGFLKLQQELTCSIINYLKQAPSKCRDLNIQMQRFSYPTWIDDNTLLTLEKYVGLIVMLSFMYFCINTVKAVSIEKEKQLKETMKIMGLPNWLHWTAWFVQSLLKAIVTIIIVSIMLQSKWYYNTDMAILTYSDFSVIFAFLIAYSCAIITFSFAVSVFFKQSNFASAITGILWFVTYFPYLMTENLTGITSLAEKLSLSLLFNSGMGYGIQQILIYEAKGTGIQWNNMWKQAAPDDNATLGYLMLILIFDSIMFFIIAVYVEQVYPGEFGVPKPWNFVCLKSTWCQSTETIENKHATTTLDKEFYEKEPNNLNVGIEIRNLGKHFDSKKMAVDNLSLNIYQGQITVLLGHNGAGKTTTMSILSGMLYPSKGTAIINGHDIKTNIEQVRGSLGLCPQHNVLFEELNVYEHLYFYCQLKGVVQLEIHKEVEKYIKLMSFEEKAKARSSTLSGGMKRKLSVAIALCGDSKVVLLDEPTAGMDPTARRELWNLLQTQKEGRTILLSTHFMDEADVLGDRIAIMARGQLQCYGSSFFLKKKYGTGYQLTIVKSSKCRVESVTQLLQKHIPLLQVKGNTGSELTYSLEKETVDVFENMLGDLEQNSEKLNVESFGVSFTTLEDVFIRVGLDSDNNNKSEANGHRFKCSFEDSQQLKLGKTHFYALTLLYRQFLAMAMKRYFSHKRSWLLILIHAIIPIAFIIFAVYIIKASQITTANLPKLKIDLQSYENSITVFEHDEMNQYAVRYEDILNSTNRSFIDLEQGNVDDVFLLSEKDLSEKRMHYIIGAKFENDSIIALFNNIPYHSPPLSLQHVMNAILHQEVSTNYSVQFFNDPLSFGYATAFARLIQLNAMGSQIAFNLGFGMSFVAAYYIIFYIHERAHKSKHLQFVSGANVLIFWTTSFIVDFIIFLFICTGVMITFTALQNEGYSSAMQLSCVMVTLLLFGLSILPFTYLVSFIIEMPSTGYTRMIMINLITGIAALLIVQVILAADLKDVADILHWIFLFSPNYALCTAIRDINIKYAVNKQCSNMLNECQEKKAEYYLLEDCNYLVCTAEMRCCELSDNYYDWDSPGIGKNLFFMSSLSIVFFTSLLMLEYEVLKNILNNFNGRRRRVFPLPNAKDKDVESENVKIRNISSNEDIVKYNLIIRDVTKYYNKFCAVSNICLGVHSFECFGLLGINGAGKTTLFKIMTGETSTTAGEIWINGLNLQTEMSHIRQLIGYCPQFDALLDDLTCRETIVIFCLIRGIDKKSAKIKSERLARKFGFYKHIDKQVKQLSLGNKRKLSMAVSLIGNPAILFLDEPTNGMDPATRHYFWKEIRKIRDSGTCIIITSHSMEECEALCTRLTIMVNGCFMCLGSIQHLKNKFSNGFTAMIKLEKNSKEEDFKNLEEYVRSNFETVKLCDIHQQLVTFDFEDTNMKWSTLFGIMEKAKKLFNIEDYALEQSSLEQVFSTFTKYQNDPQNDLKNTVGSHVNEISHF